MDLAYQDLDGDKPENFQSGPSENPEDENVALDDEENLPWPDPVKIANWWQQTKHRYAPGVRHLAGVPVAVAQCRRVLAEGYQRQRNAAALELALIINDQPLPETRAPGWGQ